MGLKAKYTNADIDKMLAERLTRINEAIVQTLSYVGEKCVNEARDFGSYMDQTGNLRSSVGYVIVVNGSVVKENFKSKNISVQYSNLKTRAVKSKRMSIGESGVSTAKAFAKEVASQFRYGYVLIVVAGMEYAGYVESYGKNVLYSAELLSSILVPRLMNQLKSKIKRLNDKYS
jgi:hypothetical protein